MFHEHCFDTGSPAATTNGAVTSNPTTTRSPAAKGYAVQRILLTGGAGFLGCHILQKLLVDTEVIFMITMNIIN